MKRAKYFLSGIVGFALGAVTVLAYLMIRALSLTAVEINFPNLLSFIETVVLSITLIFLALQIRYQGKDIREEINARQVEVLFQIFSSLDTDKAKENRKYVYTKLPDAKEKLSERDLKIANDVWTSLDHVGLIVKYGLADEELVMEMYCEAIIKCWLKLKDHIFLQRKERGGRYQKYFEMLAKRAEEYHKSKYPNDRIQFYSHPENGCILF